MFILCATARTPRAVQLIPGSEHLGLTVCANGAVVWDATSDEVITESAFDSEALRERLCALRAAQPALGFAVLTSRAMFAEPRYVGDRKRRDLKVVLDVCEVLAGASVVCLAVRRPGLQAEAFFSAVQSALEGVGVPSIASGPTVDVAPHGVTKATAVARVIEESGHWPYETVVFGDMPNDLPLFPWAAYAFAVGNAAPTVKVAADQVIASNDDDGVAQAIRDILDGTGPVWRARLWS